MSGEKAFPSKPFEPFLQKAGRFIQSAQLLEAEGDFDSAASRLYYAMFFVAQALLASRGLSFSSHKATLSAFGQQFAKKQELDPKYHKALINAFSQRQLGDYAIFSGLRKEDIEVLLAEAISFLNVAREYLEDV